jgi:tetratricopeptide (TPR) repeat protein
MERGIYKQDDLGDIPGAIADYKQSLSLNSLADHSCQIVTGAIPATGGPMTPAPCMFTVRLRLAGLLRESSPADAIALYQEVAKIDPLKFGVHAAIAETYAEKAATESGAAATADYNSAVTEYQNELALSPITQFTISLTGDLANNAHVHWALAEIYHTLGNSSQEASELDLYLKATKWHSDTYPWRITLATTRLTALGGAPQAKPKDPIAPSWNRNSPVKP